MFLSFDYSSYFFIVKTLLQNYVFDVWESDSNFENVLREQGDLSDETHKPCNYRNYETIPLQVRTHK